MIFACPCNNLSSLVIVHCYCGPTTCKLTCRWPFQGRGLFAKHYQVASTRVVALHINEHNGKTTSATLSSLCNWPRGWWDRHIMHVNPCMIGKYSGDVSTELVTMLLYGKTYNLKQIIKCYVEWVHPQMNRNVEMCQFLLTCTCLASTTASEAHNISVITFTCYYLNIMQ